MFVKESDALVMLPGGFGTLDEGTEVLTLLQNGKRDMVAGRFPRRAQWHILGTVPDIRRG